MITFDDAIRVNGSIIARGVIDRVNALLDGKTLVCRHELYGEFRFWLNPQQNVICCEAFNITQKRTKCVVIIQPKQESSFEAMTQLSFVQRVLFFTDMVSGLSKRNQLPLKLSWLKFRASILN